MTSLTKKIELLERTFYWRRRCDGPSNLLLRCHKLLLHCLQLILQEFHFHGLHLIRFYKLLNNRICRGDFALGGSFALNSFVLGVKKVHGEIFLEERSRKRAPCCLVTVSTVVLFAAECNSQQPNEMLIRFSHIVRD